MGQTVEQVEVRISQARQRLGGKLHALEAKVAAETNWRTHFVREPHLWLGVAFAVGFVLSGSTGRGNGRIGRALRAETGTPTFDKFVGGLTALAVDRAKEYVETKLPGFSRAFDNS